MKVYKAKTKRQTKSGKTLWVDVGFTVFVRDEGRISLVDDRTDTSFYLFEAGRRKGDGQQSEPKQSEPQQGAADAPDDQIPF